MLRQRVRLRGSSLTGIVRRVLVVVFALGLVWHGSMLVLLAFKTSPQTVNDLSGYRDAYDYLAGLHAEDITGEDRVIIAVVGVVVGALCAAAAWRGLPRPHFSRTALTLPDSGRGVTDIAPRAIERAVEAAAMAHPSVISARARYDDGALVLNITARLAETIVQTLREVQDRALDSLARHELVTAEVAVTLTGYDRQNRRELA